jgi:hypothetical protein
VIETFPTYTLHNEVHALNVVRGMGDLLGARIEEITALEGAVLISSAYLHDVGMVFTPEERESIRNERWFNPFLERHADAFVAVQQNGDVPLEIAEWYCRWRHADRVTVYLDSLPPELLRWEGTTLKDRLATVCRSHNYDHAALHEAVFKTDFRIGDELCDLRMCAVLLRLADILDFDNSRSPADVYEYLGLVLQSQFGCGRLPAFRSREAATWRRQRGARGGRAARSSGPRNRPGCGQTGWSSCTSASAGGSDGWSRGGAHWPTYRAC